MSFDSESLTLADFHGEEPTQRIPVLTAEERMDAYLANLPTCERPTRELLMRASDVTRRFNVDSNRTRAQTQPIALVLE